MTTPDPLWYVAADEFGDDTIWRHDPKYPGTPRALLSNYDIASNDLWDWIIRDLPTAPPA